MEIVRNIPDLQTAIGSSTVCHCGFGRKPNGGHHAGHVACISGAKQISDLVLISYFPNEDCMTYLFSPTYSGAEPEWDETYCIDFCDDHGVDIVFIPTFSYLESNFFAGENIADLKSWASSYSTTNGYDVLGIDSFSYLTMQWILIAEKIRSDNSYWRKDALLGCWKDAPLRFMYKHFAEDYLSIPATLIDPIRRPDGIPYGTQLAIFGAEDIARLAQVKSKIEEVSFDLYNSDPEQYKATVASGINTIDTRQEKEFWTAQIDLHTGSIVGASNLLINVSIHVRDTEENNGYCVTEYYEGVVN
jgi:hypothetical protein